MMNKSKIHLSFISVIISIVFVINLFPMLEIVVSAENTDTKQSETFPVDYDPNEGMITYGHTGDIGMRAENDTDNLYTKTDNVVYFPSDLIELKNENGELMFKDYSSDNSYYDYSDMLNKALEIARNKDNADVFIEDGVYYFAKSIYLWGYTSINATAGNVAFIIKPNFQDIDGNPVEVNGFFTNANLEETYSWYFAGISDIAFAVEGTHDSFTPDNTAENIISDLCSDDVEAVDGFNLFYRMRIK